ncbi:MAG: HAD family hydrolase [Paracoccaceae bacterium]
MKIAMWSGPRNLSTAMMFAFGARKDCHIWDEPFYAAYLHATGLKHPMRAEILAAGEQDPNKVIAACLAPPSDGKAVFFQKHMTQHMIAPIERGWIDDMTNIFLIRDPARVIASYAAKRENPTLDDIGFRQQVEIFDAICQKTGSAPPVIDSYAIRKDPEKILRKLCAKIGLNYDPRMLHWPKGGHIASGVWQAHWYDAAEQSTGFAGPEGPTPSVPSTLQDVWEGAQGYYEKIKKHAL